MQLIAERIYKMAIRSISALVVSFAFAAPAATQSVLIGDFEGGGAPGKFIYSDDSVGLSIRYYSSSLNRVYSYIVGRFDECSSVSLYKTINSNKIVLDGSCSSRGGQIYKYVYEWNASYSNWCLIREITGEKADIESGKLVPAEQVSRTTQCSTIGAVESPKYEPPDEVIQHIRDELDEFRRTKTDSRALRKYISSFPSYGISELAAYVDVSTVIDINDFAFYLSKNGRSYEAISLLGEVVRKFPERATAKLNLADSYWENGFEKPASLMYKAYIDKVESDKYRIKIPDRAVERAKK